MKEFNLFGHIVKIDDNLEIYNSYRISYIELELLAEKEFSKFIRECNTIEKLIEQSAQMANKFVALAIDESIKKLYSIGINNVDRDRFIEKYYYKYFNYNKHLSPLQEKYIKITQTAKELERYRQMEKNSRSRWQGGGFGLKGAIKGAATAGALNFGSDFIHSFGDSLKSSTDSKKIKELKIKLLNEYKYNGQLWSGIRNCIVGCFNGFIEEMVHNNRIRPILLSEKEALAIYKNTAQYEKDPHKMIKNILECIMKYPYNPMFYEILYSINSKEKGLLEMVDFFGLSKGKCGEFKIEYDAKELNDRTFNGIVYKTKEERIKVEKEYKSNIDNMIIEVSDFVRSKNVDFMNMNKTNHNKCIEFVSEIEKKYKINILKDEYIINSNIYFDCTFLRKYISQCEELKNDYEKYQEKEKNDSNIKDKDDSDIKDKAESDIKENSSLSIKDILIVIVICILIYIYMSPGIIKTIILAFLGLGVAGCIYESIERKIKKNTREDEIKKYNS